ncbi:Ubiquitin-like protein SMT3 [Mycena sanguinolenta]|uniref:Ubiquitin-like protein SMT3 n=1 Tax=Mycena sanguinolenta TaxID=230812 RepID=A0A8H7D782_9AGAR|nr:Ubiquitin-like protein SMT3 [Mycena sanguinolenta]
MSQEPEDVKPKLNLNITYEGNQITVKVKANTKFAKIFQAAEQKFGKESGKRRVFSAVHPLTRLLPSGRHFQICLRGKTNQQRGYPRGFRYRRWGPDRLFPGASGWLGFPVVVLYFPRSRRSVLERSTIYQTFTHILINGAALSACASPPTWRLRLQLSAFPPHEDKVRVKIQFGEHYQLFDMKKDKDFGVAMSRFAQKINHELASLRFHYDGSRVRESDTPNSLQMDELDTTGGNIIDVALMQIGG